MFSGLMVTLDVSLLLNETITPPAGAGFINVTEIGADWPGSTVTLDARTMSEGGTTEILAIASGISGRALA
jgi:hypothetical protein